VVPGPVGSSFSVEAEHDPATTEAMATTRIILIDETL
jgi:hypothetical protein